jgi:hypothetical protein
MGKKEILNYLKKIPEVQGVIVSYELLNSYDGNIETLSKIDYSKIKNDDIFIFIKNRIKSHDDKGLYYLYSNINSDIFSVDELDDILDLAIDYSLPSIRKWVLNGYKIDNIIDVLYTNYNDVNDILENGMFDRWNSYSYGKNEIMDNTWNDIDKKNINTILKIVKKEDKEEFKNYNSLEDYMNGSDSSTTDNIIREIDISIDDALQEAYVDEWYKHLKEDIGDALNDIGIPYILNDDFSVIFKSDIDEKTINILNVFFDATNSAHTSDIAQQVLDQQIDPSSFEYDDR